MNTFVFSLFCLFSTIDNIYFYYLKKKTQASYLKQIKKPIKHNSVIIMLHPTSWEKAICAGGQGGQGGGPSMDEGKGPREF